MASIIELGKSWTTIYAHHQKLRNTVLQMIAHPEATDDQIQEAVRTYRSTTISLRKVHKRTVEAANKLSTGRGTVVYHIVDKIKSQRI